MPVTHTAIPCTGNIADQAVSTVVKTTWQSLQWLTVHNKTSGTAREVLDEMEKRLG